MKLIIKDKKVKCPSCGEWITFGKQQFVCPWCSKTFSVFATRIGMEKTFKIECPNDHGPMKIIKEKETVAFRGKELIIETEGYECPTCKIKTTTIRQSAKKQKVISDAYKSEDD